MTDRETKSRPVATNKGLIIQTILFIITLIGIAVANERRITTIEVRSALETDIVAKLQSVTTLLSDNQIRVVVLLDKIEERHRLEDQRRAADAKLKNNGK
jgi:hypothetical protein